MRAIRNALIPALAAVFLAGSLTAAPAISAQAAAPATRGLAAFASPPRAAAAGTQGSQGHHITIVPGRGTRGTRGGVTRLAKDYLAGLRARDVTLSFDLACPAPARTTNGLISAGVYPGARTTIHICARGNFARAKMRTALRFTLAHEYGHLLEHRHALRLSASQQRYLARSNHIEQVADCAAQAMTGLSASRHGDYVTRCTGTNLKIGRQLAHWR